MLLLHWWRLLQHHYLVYLTSHRPVLAATLYYSTVTALVVPIVDVAPCFLREHSKKVTEKAAVGISAVVSADEDSPATVTSVAVFDVSTPMTASLASEVENERAPIADGGLPAADRSAEVEASKAHDAIPPKMSDNGSLCEQAKMTAGAVFCDTDIKGEFVEEETTAVGGVLADDGPSDAVGGETLLSDVTGMAVPTEMHFEGLPTEIPGREEGGVVMTAETASEAVNGVVVEQTQEESGGDDVVSKNTGPVTSVPKADGVDNEAEQRQGDMDVSSTLGRSEKGAAAKIAM